MRHLRAAKLEHLSYGEDGEHRTLYGASRVKQFLVARFKRP